MLNSGVAIFLPVPVLLDMLQCDRSDIRCAVSWFIASLANIPPDRVSGYIHTLPLIDVTNRLTEMITINDAKQIEAGLCALNVFTTIGM